MKWGEAGPSQYSLSAGPGFRPGPTVVGGATLGATSGMSQIRTIADTILSFSGPLD